MVLSHGITDSAECWPGVAALLAGHFDLVMVDARGHGKSGRPEAGYSYEKQVSALRAVDWEQTVDALHCPTLLVTGDVAAGAIVTRTIAEAAVQRNPRLREIRVGGAGHSIRRDRRAAFLEALCRFLL